jgi:heterodisulfide reductase subunit C
MSALKQIAAQARTCPAHRSGTTQFYLKFMESVRRHGRVREMEFMTLYFCGHEKPAAAAASFASLGMRLMAKGKVPLQLPSKGRRPAGRAVSQG